MALDPDAAALIDRLRELQPPRYETMTPTKARAVMLAARQAAAIVPPPVERVRDIAIPASHGVIGARLYRPLGAAGMLPALIFFHGGGWVLGDLDSHDILCRRLANAGACAVLAIDYRRAPEHKFPAAVEDAIAAASWAFAHAKELEIDLERVAVGGDSAGGNLAAVVAHVSRDGALPRFCLQVLIYPVVDLASTYPSHNLEGAFFPVLGKTMIWFRDHYLQYAEHRQDWRVSPLLAENFADLPPAYVLTVGYDPLSDEGVAYAEKLRAAGVDVAYRHFPGQFHGFMTVGVGFPTTQTALVEIGTALKRALGAPR